MVTKEIPVWLNVSNGSKGLDDPFKHISVNWTEEECDESLEEGGHKIEAQIVIKFPEDRRVFTEAQIRDFIYSKFQAANHQETWVDEQVKDFFNNGEKHE